ncbi:hypothetical protein ABE179_08740 [Aliarcobacter skirrowii]|uniref:hypothetical protein n=1 Tax=Aliarcobacter skirrowii TaxID=28200 RepID=UPI0029BF0CAD|nr:hypothetical protein [Aliarcobacter skirrowii]MDX4062264.1 hypothetical protein [Aliarcobacter skirrowii]
MRFFLILFLPIFLFAHKVNLFLDLKDDNLYINSYFGNAKPCKSCKFKIESDGLVFESRLDENGEYNYKSSNDFFKVTVDAGSSHFVSKDIKVSKKIAEVENKEKIEEDKKIKELLEENTFLKNRIEVLETQLNYFEIFKIAFGLILIAFIFLIIKRVKS